MLMSYQFVVAESEHRREQLKEMYRGRTQKPAQAPAARKGELRRQLLRLRRAWSV